MSVRQNIALETLQLALMRTVDDVLIWVHLCT